MLSLVPVAPSTIAAHQNAMHRKILKHTPRAKMRRARRPRPSIHRLAGA